MQYFLYLIIAYLIYRISLRITYNTLHTLPNSIYNKEDILFAYLFSSDFSFYDMKFLKELISIRCNSRFLIKIEIDEFIRKKFDVEILETIRLSAYDYFVVTRIRRYLDPPNFYYIKISFLMTLDNPEPEMRIFQSFRGLIFRLFRI